MRYRWMFAYLLLALSSAGNSQTPGGTWGPWSRLTTATTGIETRVKCESSVESDSLWAYQFKNLNDHTVDMVEKEQHGLANSRANGFGAGAMFTLDAGKVSYPYEGTMHGTCAQIHNLRIEFVCVVPHGQDHPCFRNADGSLVATKNESSKGTDKVEATSAKAKDMARYAYCEWVLLTGDARGYYATHIFSRPQGVPWPPVVEIDAWNKWVLSRQFWVWLGAQPQYRNALEGSVDPNSWTNLSSGGSLVCIPFDTREEAQKHYESELAWRKETLQLPIFELDWNGVP